MSPAPNFNHLARPYRWLEYLTFGPFLQRTRTHFLPALQTGHQALVLGDGDGRFTAALFAANPNVRIHAVDGSTAMLNRLRTVCSPYQDRLSVESADLRDWGPSSEVRYDLIASHFFLDCLTTEQIAALVLRINRNVAPDSLWLISDFAVPANVFGRLFARPLVSMLYSAFNLLTGLTIHRLPDHAEALRTAGWVRIAQHPRLCGLLVSELWQHP